MAKIYCQNFPIVWQTTASLAASGSTGGSALCGGYARLVGGIVSAASAKAASGLRIWQSFDQGTNWDFWSDYVPSASSASAFSIEIIGNAVKVDFRTDATGASILRALWQLRPV